MDDNVLCKFALRLKINCKYSIMLCDTYFWGKSVLWYCRKKITWIQDKPNKSSKVSCWYPQRENPLFWPVLGHEIMWMTKTLTASNCTQRMSLVFLGFFFFFGWSMATLLSTKASSLLFLGAFKIGPDGGKYISVVLSRCAPKHNYCSVIE